MAVLEALVQPASPSNVVPSDPLLDSCTADSALAAPLVRAAPRPPSAAGASGHQRRQPLDGRHGQDPGRGRARGMAAAQASARRSSAAAIGAARMCPASSWSRTASASGGARRSGDEPLMLARAVPGAIVCVCRIVTWPACSPSGSWARPFTCWTMAFSICIWRAISDVLVTSPGEIGGGRVVPSAGCASRGTPPLARTCWS